MLKGWRTVLVNIAFAAFAAAAELLSYLAIFDWRSVLPPEYAPYVVLSVNVLNIVLRASTTSRVGEAPASIKIEGDITA